MTTRMVNTNWTAPLSSGVNGHNYYAAPGGFVDAADTDVAQMTALGWVSLGLVGPTGARPSTYNNGVAMSASAGLKFIDLTIGRVVIWDGIVWRDPATAAAL